MLQLPLVGVLPFLRGAPVAWLAFAVCLAAGIALAIKFTAAGRHDLPAKTAARELNQGDAALMQEQTFRRLMRRLQSRQMDCGELDDIQAEIDRLCLLLGRTDNGPTRSLSLLAEIDWVQTLLSPVITRHDNRINVHFDPAVNQVVDAPPRILRRLLLHCIYRCLVYARPINITLSLDRAAGVTSIDFPKSVELKPPANLLHQLPVTLDGSRLIVSGVSARPADPAFNNLTALVICDDHQQRASLISRLTQLGVQCTDKLDDSISFCVVSDECQPALHVLGPTVRDQHVLLLESRELPGNENWLLVDRPLTQTGLAGCISSISDVTAASRSNQVLLVDDNPANTRLLVAQLQALGVDVTIAVSGATAIEAAADRDYRLVLMDIQMPDMDGIETTRRIRDLGTGVPVFGLTAHAAPDERDRCMQAGMQDILIKPVRLDRLKRLLSAAPRAQPMRAERHGNEAVFDLAMAMEHADDRIDIAQEMLRLLAESLPQDMDNINASAGQPEALRKQVHTLHGALRYCGAARLLTAVRQLEQSLAAGCIDESLIAGQLNRVNSEATAFLTWYHDHPDALADSEQSNRA